MGEMSSEGANLGAGIDLSQFYQVFFEEAGENLDRMEQQLLEINIEQADDEELNSIFRCAHSVKGGAATFGLMVPPNGEGPREENEAMLLLMSNAPIV